jgi:hypothetical protein
MNRQPSLRRRLLLAGGVGLLLVSLLASALLGELFKRSARDRLDHELQQDMLTLLSQAEVDPDGQLRLRQEPNDARFQRVFSGAYWQIAGADGRVLLQSRSLWDETLPAKAAGPATRNLPGRCSNSCVHACSRCACHAPANRSWPWSPPIAARWMPMLPRSAAHRHRPGRAGRGVAGGAGQPGALRPAPAASPRCAAGTGTARRCAAHRHTGLGAEVAPLGEELNALLDHQQRMVARARTSAQDLAHALKTPLSVLATEADGDGTHWRATVREQSARMQASVDRYLAAGLAADHRQRTDVAAVAQAMCRLMARVHGERGIAFTAAGIDPALQFAGASADLEEMLGNLLDNAGRWAQQQVTVEAETSEGQLRIEVRDDGPGLAADALERVTQRGVRLDEREGSSGLGLAIVGDIAASYGGRVALENAQPGLRATLWLPVA